MTRTLTVKSVHGTRSYTEATAPWSIGGDSAAHIILDDAQTPVLAYIGWDDGHYFIQPAAADLGLHHNGRPLAESRWLQDGDRLFLDGYRLVCSLENGDLTVEIVGRAPPLETTAGTSPRNSENTDAPAYQPRHAAPKNSHRGLTYALVGFLGLLVLAVVFVLVAVPLHIVVEPAPENLEIKGFLPPIKVAGQPLVMPGTYRVQAQKTGYLSLDEEITVSDSQADFSFILEKEPGLLSVTTMPEVGAEIYIGAQNIGSAPLTAVEVPAGLQVLRVLASRYLPVEEEIEIAGMGQHQQRTFELEPAWAKVSLSSVPAQVVVEIDGVERGMTPVALELIQGQRSLRFKKDKYVTETLEVEIVAGEDQELAVVRLLPLPGRLVLATIPPGAIITVNDTYLGATPLTVALPSGKRQSLQASLPGYRTVERAFTFAPGETKELDVKLQQEFGTVFVRADPPDAQLKVDGKIIGDAVQRLRLSTVPHKIEITKPGYAPFSTVVRPKAGLSDEINVVLKSIEQAEQEQMPPLIVTAAGQQLHLVTPGSFVMGASRREPGRRANEIERKIKLTRRYYLSEYVVTNTQFKKFKRNHAPQNVSSAKLDLDDQPAVSVSWDDAARYLNWLSAADRLPVAYAQVNGRMMTKAEPGAGYRLPTEAEWAWAARMAGRPSRAIYPWGSDFPPGKGAGNFADVSARGLVPTVLEKYNDRYPVTAPVGNFPPNPAGFFDMGSNVTEWVQDYYDVRIAAANLALIDPVGPATGTHHVVRGAGWRSASAGRLRLSYRDYSAEPRPDMGFRIARFADEG